MGACDHLLHYGGGQALLNSVGLCSIDECGDGDGLDIRRERNGVAGGVIAAGGGKKSDQEQHQIQPLRGRNSQPC